MIKTLYHLEMENVSTMNLNDFSIGSETPIKLPEEKPNLVYQPNVIIPPEKNIVKPKEMDSTPINDIMMPSEGYEMAPGPAGGGPDPRFMMAPQPSYVQQQMPTPMGYQQKPKQGATQSKNPMNLTDEQVEALLAGAVALLAFSGFAQDKLSTMIPKFLDETGKQSTVGMLVTALLAAILFYFGRRFVIKD
jgi:hypothetical protein